LHERQTRAAFLRIGKIVPHRLRNTSCQLILFDPRRTRRLISNNLVRFAALHWRRQRMRVN